MAKHFQMSKFMIISIIIIKKCFNIFLCKRGNNKLKNLYYAAQHPYNYRNLNKNFKIKNLANFRVRCNQKHTAICCFLYGLFVFFRFYGKIWMNSKNCICYKLPSLCFSYKRTNTVPLNYYHSKFKIMIFFIF